MPFVSQAQRRFMHARHPELAKEFEAKTPKGANLPERASSPFHAAAKERAGYRRKKKVHHRKGGKCR